MFEDNWYLFLLIVMIVFISDGDSPFDEFSDDYPRENNERDEEKGNKGDGNVDCDNENDGANDK